MGDFFGFLVDHWMLSGAFVIILVILVMHEAKRKVLGFKDVPPDEAVRLINNQDAVVVDVREENEFKEGHILNALHIPVGLLEARIGDLESSRDKTILLYCRSGQRSAQAGVILNKQGFQQVYKLGGGIMAWQSANLPLVK